VWLADITRELQYERMLARELDMEAGPDIVSPQNLIGIVTELMQRSGRGSKVCVGMVALEGIGLPKARGSMTRDETLRRFFEIARQCTRKQDIIAHSSDASFVFIFSGVGIHIAATITRRIHDTMTAVFSAYGAGGISFSAGFMELMMPGLAALTSTDILRAAERQLGYARRRGGSLFVSQELTARLRD
jgi:GGDEF domain-containing protein